MNARIRLSESGTELTGITRTFVTIRENLAPEDTFTLEVSTTYSKSKNPHDHHIKHRLYLDRTGLDKLSTLLGVFAGTTNGENNEKR